MPVGFSPNSKEHNGKLNPIPVLTDERRKELFGNKWENEIKEDWVTANESRATRMDPTNSSYAVPGPYDPTSRRIMKGMSYNDAIKTFKKPADVPADIFKRRFNDYSRRAREAGYFVMKYVQDDETKAWYALIIYPDGETRRSFVMGPNGEFSGGQRLGHRQRNPTRKSARKMKSRKHTKRSR